MICRNFNQPSFESPINRDSGQVNGSNSRSPNYFLTVGLSASKTFIFSELLLFLGERL